MTTTRYLVTRSSRPSLESLQLHEVENGQEIENELMHRLSVAYGLTFDAEILGEAILPQKIEDFEPVEAGQDRPD